MGFWNKIFGTKIPDGYTKVRIQEFIDANMVGGVIPIDLFIELQNNMRFCRTILSAPLRRIEKQNKINLKQ